MKQDVYERVTAHIVTALESGVRPWFQPWNAEHAAGRITRPLRANGQPYRGINVLMLWGAACACGFNAPIWMTYKQAQELGGNVRKSAAAHAQRAADYLHSLQPLPDEVKEAA